MRLRRLALIPLLVVVVFCAAPAVQSSPAPAPPAASRPTLVVLITVDQMRPDYFDRWKSQLTGGFKRLASGGAFFTDAHQDHAITETAPGHASLLSGRFPRSTGITRNLAGVIDANSPLIGHPGPGASPFRFRGSALFDWMHAATPDSRALSVSYKDRGAILPVGRSKQEVYWYVSTGRFTTSRWYRDSLPDWVKAFNARELPRSYAGKSWNLLLPASAYAEPDSVPIESSGRGFVFPHTLSASPDTAAAQLPGFPFMDEITAALALDGVNALGLGKGPAPDLLAVSFSATDLIGHRYGPDSREIHDQILRMDRILGGFLDSLFKLRDSTSIAIVLSADHGVQPYPELNNGRLTPAPLRPNLAPALELLKKMITDSGGNPGALDFESGALFLVRDSVKVSDRWARIAVDSFIAVTRRIPGVLRVDRLGDLARRDLAKDAVARRWVQMFPPDTPVEAVVTLTPGSYWGAYPIAQHGTPHPQDSNVPIVFYGPWFKPGRYGQFVRTVDIGPTLAQVLGVTPTEPLDGRVLRAALR
jgi:predicted AlkP superfamily pyrophosphatase or phosphodiesterase